MLLRIGNTTPACGQPHNDSWYCSLRGTGFEHVTDKPEEAAVWIFSADPEKFLMVKAPEAVGYVTLDKPDGPGPGDVNVPQCGMTSPASPGPWELSPDCRWSMLPAVFRRFPRLVYLTGTARREGGASRSCGNVAGAGRRKPVPFLPHLPMICSIFPRTSRPPSPRRFRVSWLPGWSIFSRMRSGTGPCEHLLYSCVHGGLLSPRSRRTPAPLRLPAFAYLMASSGSSPVPLHPVVRLQRSPDWADVTPPITTGTPSP